MFIITVSIDMPGTLLRALCVCHLIESSQPPHDVGKVIIPVFFQRRQLRPREITCKIDQLVSRNTSGNCTLVQYFLLLVEYLQGPALGRHPSHDCRCEQLIGPRAGGKQMGGPRAHPHPTVPAVPQP